MRIGIDLGGTKIEGIVLSDAGELLARRRVSTPHEYGQSIEAITHLVTELEHTAGETGTLGVGIPGTIVPATGLVKNANSVWLNGRALGEDLERRLARPVRLMNDANCFALSEATDGAAAGANVVFGVILGTGVGGGIRARRGVALASAMTAALPALVLAPLLVAVASVTPAQGPRATLRVQWTADSSWEGEYYHKPYRFHVHEELAGRLVFAVDDASLLPSASGEAAGTRAVRAIQLRDDGAITGGRLANAAGTSTYWMDVHKEGGDCAIPADSVGASTVEPPFEGHEETTAAWDSVSPGALLIVLRGAEPIGVAFSPKSMPVTSGYRLLCPNPERVTRRQTFRMAAKFGAALGRPRADTTGAPPGSWSVETSRTARGGYTVKATYTAVVRQPVALSSDKSAATGRLDVKKTFVITWEKAE